MVSPAQEKPDAGSTRPAIWSPELKMYWSGVPLGQKPPPPTGEPANATQVCPSFWSPHAIRFVSNSRPELAKRLMVRGRPGTPGAGFATATDANAGTASAIAAAAPTKRFHENERM